MVKSLAVVFFVGCGLGALAQANPPENHDIQNLIHKLQQHVQAIGELVGQLAQPDYLKTLSILKSASFQDPPAPLKKSTQPHSATASVSPKVEEPYPQLPRSDKIPGSFPTSSQQTLHPRALYEKALDLLLQGLYSESIVALKTLLQKYPESPYTEDSCYWLAVALLHGGQVQVGLDKMEAFLETYPKSPRVPEALLKIYKALLSSGKPSAAGEVLERLIREFPHHPRRVEIRQEYQKLQEGQQADKDLTRD